MAIRCGSCKDTHDTVAEVRSCYEQGSVPAHWATGMAEQDASEQVYRSMQAVRRSSTPVREAREVRMATEAQRSYLGVLLETKEIPEGMEADAAALSEMLANKVGIEFDRAGRMITQLKLAPRARKTKDFTGEPAGRVDRDGMFYDPNTGTVYRVQVAVHGSGNLYAKRLEMTGYQGDSSDEYISVTLTDIRQAKDPEYAGIQWEVKFRYAAGAISKIKPEWRMTKEDASKFGALYGSCVKCGLPLTKEESIERGMGDICAGKEGYWA